MLVGSGAERLVVALTCRQSDFDGFTPAVQNACGSLGRLLRRDQGLRPLYCKFKNDASRLYARHKQTCQLLAHNARQVVAPLNDKLLQIGDRQRPTEEKTLHLITTPFTEQ
jgi:hypothetical protein